MKQSFLFLLLFSQLISNGQRASRILRPDRVKILYPENIRLHSGCVGDSVKISAEIGTTSEKMVKLFGFSMTQTKYELFANGNLLTETDSFIIDKHHPIELRIRFRIDKAGISGPVVKFSSDQKGYQTNEMKFEFGAYHISIDQIRSGKEQFLSLRENCSDSIKVYFPYGGTQSGASLYSDSTTQQQIKSVSYGIMEEGNYLTFSKKDIGRYYVRYGACHWGNNFWMTIK